MFAQFQTKTVAAVLLGLAIVGVHATNAQAFGWGWGGCGWGGCGWGGCASYSYGGCYDSCGYASCSYGGCYDSCGYGYSDSYCYSGGGCYGCGDSYGFGVPYAPGGAAGGGAAGGAYGTPSGGGAGSSTKPPRPNPEIMPEARLKKAFGSGAATFSVSVPQDAKLYFAGKPTTTEGAVRQFISRGLASRGKYLHTVRAEVVRGGKTIRQTQSIQVRAGQHADVAFDFDAMAGPTTKLTLNVPPTARVTLSGSKTSRSGAVRVFSTKKLAAGQELSDLKVRVTLEKNGQTLVRERTVSLRAGQSKSLAIDFDDEQLAAR